MSKIGKKPIEILENVDVSINGDVINVKGPKGELVVPALDNLNIDIKDGIISVTTKLTNVQTKMNWGTQRSLINNAIDGVVKGYEKVLEINGVGFKAELKDRVLVLKVGFSHLVNFDIPDGIEIRLEKNRVYVSGINKELVGQVAANIRKVKKPEPYLGKGIKYEDEIIRRKVGKRAAGTTT